jgi:hypothetical protein
MQFFPGWGPDLWPQFDFTSCLKLFAFLFVCVICWELSDHDKHWMNVLFLVDESRKSTPSSIQPLQCPDCAFNKLSLVRPITGVDPHWQFQPARRDSLCFPDCSLASRPERG